MGWSLFEPMVRTDFALGLALPTRLASLAWAWGLTRGKGSPLTTASVLQQLSQEPLCP